ncbi:acetate--CoA ligase family protein [Mangrovibacterium lignilyticum]|uniref:acetate--CoA ligase family protein n=1 Tax=Mangrovibacterium lignilyticum TaxID=2668052 RepID=UPI0013D2AC06|nr:acetate--CoA ligase [Mangrovibacterium lignilyticum]
MLNHALLHPKSIVVVGASNKLAKPGGHLLHNLLQHSFEGKLYVVNPKEAAIQGIPACASIADLPKVDLAILAIPAEACVEAVQQLVTEKATKAFIIISAGFAEDSDRGKVMETELLELMNRYGASLIGPNCIGLMNPQFAGVFTSPVPKLDPKGIDFVTGSGGTAVFILESGMGKGLRFASVFSVGNSTQIGVEEVLEYWDETFDPVQSSRVKLLYLENIRDPQKLLKHARSLVLKGCRIAAIKAGTEGSGVRAAQSHTGAMASSDLAVDALFRKAGIIRCYGREELTTVAGLLLSPELKGNRLAIVTHAGGPAVMLADALEKGGFQVPRISDSEAKAELKAKLYPGSSVENPIDFLATGNADQLGEIIDACENEFPDVDAMLVIFGSPGLWPVDDVYEVLADKMKSCRKPIYAVLPSVVNAADAIQGFINSGHVCFPDEVELAKALLKIRQVPKLNVADSACPVLNELEVRKIMEASADGFLNPGMVHRLLDAAGIPRVKELLVTSEAAALQAADEFGFPVVLKVVGPLHKTDVGGVALNIVTKADVSSQFHRMMKIPGANAVLVAQMASGMELFLGAKKEAGFGHLILCGMGGIWLELMKDIQYGLAPLTVDEALQMIQQLKAYSLLQGYRGQKGVDIAMLADLLCRLSELLRIAPEISEMDLNPILAEGDRLLAVDVRISLSKEDRLL